MAELFDKYTLQIDIRYMEFLLNAFKECRSLNLHKNQMSRGERIYKISIQNKTIDQLDHIIKQHKREAQLYNA